MTAREAFAEAAAALTAAGVEAPRLDARLLLAEAFGASGNTPASSLPTPNLAQRAKFEAMIARRAAREPLAYILGRKEFWSLDFEVGPGVLVPRPETETLIETLLQLMPDRQATLDILDLGTGSACLLIAALGQYAKANGTGVEKSADAFTWARHNVSAHQLGGRTRLEAVDWCTMPFGRFDVILSNPPYVKSADLAAVAPEVARFEPIVALDGGADGLDAYRALAPRISAMLKPGGVALIEIGAGQASSVPALFGASGVNTERIVPDLAGIPRCLAVRVPDRANP